ncbi:MAG: P-loop NTPase fold protein, partial [Cyanobacteria bacterium J06633_2]
NVLSLSTVEEQDKLLEKELGNRFPAWKIFQATTEATDPLWATLNPSRQAQEDLKQAEKDLHDKEQQLQRQRTNIETQIKRHSSRQATLAFWTPFINAIARLHFSEEEIETATTEGDSAKLLVNTLKSWQGLVALWLLGLVVALSPVLPGTLQALWIRLLLNLQESYPEHIVFLRELVNNWFVQIPGGVALFAALWETAKRYITAFQRERSRIKSDQDTKLAQAKEQSSKLDEEVAQLRQKVKQQRQRVGLTACHSSLTEFVNARLSEGSYNKHLGLMQQVKHDIEALSEKLTPNYHDEAHQKQLQNLFPRGPARVILFIDDLDRCPPPRVVEVLEAVQLLLKTELFIVVLAIDDRYIARALEQVYSGVLTRRGKPSGIDYLEKIIQIPYRMRPIAPSTVENYLRSQVAVDKDTDTATEAQHTNSGVISKARQTVDAGPLLTPSPSKPDLPASPNGQNFQPTDEVPIPPEQSSDHSSPISQTISQESKSVSTGDNHNRQSHSGKNESETPERVPEAVGHKPSRNQQPQQTAIDNTRQDKLSQQLLSQEELSQEELSQEETAQVTAVKPLSDSTANPASSNIFFRPFIKMSGAELEAQNQIDSFDPETFEILVHCSEQVELTPRTGKRLVNVCKILQIIWKNPKTQTPNVESKTLIIAFLALSSRYPDFVRDLFEEITTELEENGISDPDLPKNQVLTKPLRELLAPIKQKLPSHSYYTKQEWRRFEGDIARMFEPNRQPLRGKKAIDTVLLNDITISRAIFNLALSFCFVGDIGYDSSDISPIVTSPSNTQHSDTQPHLTASDTDSTS